MITAKVLALQALATQACLHAKGDSIIKPGTTAVVDEENVLAHRSQTG